MEPIDLQLDRARRGDHGAFTALVRTYDNELRAYAWRMLRDRSLMDDALQNAYLSAYRALPRFRGDSSVRSWLYRIVHNACIDLIRRRRDHAELDAHLSAGPPESDHVATRMDIVRAVAALPEDRRAVLLLVDVEGFDYESAADILGVPVGTVRSRLNRARAALRIELGDQS